MIRLKDVQMEYENGTKAIKGITLTIEDGEFVIFGGTFRFRQIDHYQAVDR